MRMIPNQPLGTTSNAETRTFDQLRAAFCGPDQNSWFAMHSLNLPRHEYKRFGEIDFLIGGPGGLIVLEVKGGGVSCHNGIWETTNRYGETARLRESPFRQAEGALHGLREKLPPALLYGLVVGYGVVMPDVVRLPESAEWDRAILANGSDFKQFENWLERLIKHWRGKEIRSISAVTPSRLSDLQKHLRPDFESVVPLNVSTSRVETQIARLTEDQLRLIDVVEVNPRVICSGGAGTGKTMLALELAKRWCASGLKTVLACQSLWLKYFLERNAVPGLVVSLVESVSVNARRSGIDKFDAMIVDEGQDILNMAALALLDDHLRGGITEGSWCFFHDINNQSGLCGSYSPDAYDYLASTGPVWIPLKTNCRNSLPILQRIQTDLEADMGNTGVGDGPAVREVVVADEEEGVRALKRELNHLIEEGFNPADIVVLSPYSFDQSWMSALAKGIEAAITVLDSSSPRTDERQAIGFAQIGDFKGLESEVVVLVDMARPGRCENSLSLHYVGMSRARALLSIICKERELAKGNLRCPTS